MPKSRNRKNHKKKVAARNVRLAVQQKQMMNVNPGTYQSANVSAPSAITKMKMTGGGGSY